MDQWVWYFALGTVLSHPGHEVPGSPGASCAVARLPSGRRPLWAATGPFALCRIRGRSRRAWAPIRRDRDWFGRGGGSCFPRCRHGTPRSWGRPSRRWLTSMDLINAAAPATTPLVPMILW